MPNDKTGWVFTLALLYACIFAILGLISYTPEYGTTYNQTTTTLLGTTVVSTFVDMSEKMCGNSGGTYERGITDDQGIFHQDTCFGLDAQSTFFGNIINNIVELGWFNAILFGPLLFVILWLIISGPKVGGSGWDGGV